MSNPFLRLLGSVSNNEGLLKDTLLRIQEGSTFEVLNNLVFFLVDPSVLSLFDWIMPYSTPIFMVAKMQLVDDIMKSGGKDSFTKEKMVELLKSLLFKDICHINTTNQPFPKIYSDDKKSILDLSLLNPLSYEESFEIQMLRCYIRLLPDIPFLIYYSENNIQYWMIQSFNGAKSTTITVSDLSKYIPSNQITQSLLSQPISLENEQITCTMASLLLSSSPLSSVHSLLEKEKNHSFVMLFSSFPFTDQFKKDWDLSIPLTTSSDLLVRYSPQAFSTFHLEADLLYEQYHALCMNYHNPTQWFSLSEETIACIEITNDYSEKIYLHSLHCNNQEEVIATIKQLLASIPTNSTLPTLLHTNTTRIGHVIQEGCDLLSSIQTDNTQKDSLTSQWINHILNEEGYLEKWFEIGLFSLTCQIEQSFKKYGIICSDTIPSFSSLEEWKDWIEKQIRILGNLGLIQSATAISVDDLQNCMNIIEKPILTTPNACMLLTIPMDMAIKVYKMVSSPEIFSFRRKRKEGKEKHLELNEIESESISLFTGKEMMKEHIRSESEKEEIKRIIENYCKEGIAKKALDCYELRNGSLSIHEDFSCLNVSVKSGCFGF